MDIIYKNIDDLKDYKNNPRKNKKAVNAVAKSIKQFGFKQPIVIDIYDNIIVGHTRKLAAKKLKMKKVPCLLADDLTEEEIKAYRIVDNRTAELAEWDDAKLSAELQELIDIEFDMDEYFDLPDNDFTKNEIKDDDFDISENEIEENETDIQSGDIFQLGEHRLMCGDSFKIEDINILIEDNKIDMVFTDPPYNMQMGGPGGCFKKQTRELTRKLEKMSDFKVNSIKHILNLSNSFYICANKELLPDYYQLFSKEWYHNLLIWYKTNPIPFTNNGFLPDLEYILFFSNKNRTWNNKLKPTSIYSKTFVSKKEKGKENLNHPTPKPIDLILPKILISSNENGIVLDLFGGSGSTLIASEQAGRRCFMMEISPQYCQVIIDRWKKYTEKKAIKIEGD